jgi:hypothetical protein
MSAQPTQGQRPACFRVIDTHVPPKPVLSNDLIYLNTFPPTSIRCPHLPNGQLTTKGGGAIGLRH